MQTRQRVPGSSLCPLCSKGPTMVTVKASAALQKRDSKQEGPRRWVMLDTQMQPSVPPPGASPAAHSIACCPRACHNPASLSPR